MKRNISLAMRCVVAVFALVVVVTGAPITVSAASNSNTVMPRYNNVANVMNYFEITSDGTAYVDSSYNGTPRYYYRSNHRDSTAAQDVVVVV